MEKDLKKGMVESDMYRDLYDFHKKFGGVELTDEYWDAVTEAAEEIVRKYRHTSMEHVVNKHVMQLLETWDTEAYKLKRAEARN